MDAFSFYKDFMKNIKPKKYDKDIAIILNMVYKSYTVLVLFKRVFSL